MSKEIIDFRSDTVTRPSKGMMDAMFSAPVGDDVFSEDPTVNELEEFAAKMFGKEAALYSSSGTQTNQIAINVHVNPGGEVITHQDSHVYKYEGGGIAKNSGASVRLVPGDRGRLKVEDIAQWINPDDVHYPVTQLISLEDTSNRGGGAIYDRSDLQKISDFARLNNLPLHLDGARLMNALVETKEDPKEYAQRFDSISLCLSKGLGAPVGSVLIGNKDFIKQARRVRKVFGGGMRQAGIIAAGGLYALKNNVERLAIDHQYAKSLEKALQACSWVESVVPVETNIVVAMLKDADKRDVVIQKLADQDIRIMAFGPGMLRFVTHLDISGTMIDRTMEVLQKLDV